MALHVCKKFEYDYRQHLVPMDEHSETIPDQSLTVRQILARCQGGLPPANLIQHCEYDDDADSYLDSGFVSPEMEQNKDLTDFDNYRKEYEELRDKISKRQKRSQETPPETVVSDQTDTDVPTSPQAV